MSEKRIPMKCRHMDELYIDKPCQLCGGNEEVQMYCGGPVAYMCKKCKAILDKYRYLKKRLEEFHRQRRINVNTQIFFRATFDNDPVKFIWG